MDTHFDLPLDCLRPGEWADVTDVSGPPTWIGRMAELGIRTGSRVRLVRQGQPCLVEVGASRLSWRDDSGAVLVRPVART